MEDVKDSIGTTVSRLEKVYGIIRSKIDEGDKRILERQKELERQVILRVIYSIASAKFDYL